MRPGYLDDTSRRRPRRPYSPAIPEGGAEDLQDAIEEKQQRWWNPSLLVHIHGDLTRPVAECGLLHELDLSRAMNAGASGTAKSVEVALDKPVELRVPLSITDDGIIGRRISVLAPSGPGPTTAFLAGGVVGFKYAPARAVPAL